MTIPAFAGMTVHGSMQSFDASLFSLLNHLSCPWLDPLMVALADSGNWWALYAVLWLALMVKGGRRGRQMGFLILPLLFVSDTLVDLVLKPLFDRPRPYLAIENVRLLVDVSENLSSRSFPSSHATNIFTAATFIALTFRKTGLTATLLVIGLLVCFSRVYIGVHYPSDVAAGAFLGISLGGAATFSWRRLAPKTFR